ncbi:MAG: MaoC family dehydratase [Deltaproteobacteria bacterium]|nr:MaoC family dehydratase [Deltaproteobacteria bacterium]
MSGLVRIEEGSDAAPVYCLSSHRRTITETDIVNFVNLTGLHEPPFIDMEWVKENMPGEHNKRFAPAPFLISLGMGLVATSITDLVATISRNEGLGPFHGMVGLEARVQRPAFPGDTLCVDLEGRVDRETERGRTLVDLKHVLKNQRGETVLVFTEKLIFDKRM